MDGWKDQRRVEDGEARGEEEDGGRETGVGEKREEGWQRHARQGKIGKRGHWRNPKTNRASNVEKSIE